MCKQGGKFSAVLLLGDPLAAQGLQWALGDVNMPKTGVKATPKYLTASQQTVNNAQPEIVHMHVSISKLPHPGSMLLMHMSACRDQLHLLFTNGACSMPPLHVINCVPANCQYLRRHSTSAFQHTDCVDVVWCCSVSLRSVLQLLCR